MTWRDVARRGAHTAIASALLGAVGAAAPAVPVDEVWSGGERGRVSLCGAMLAATDPALFLPGELSTIVLSGCPTGTVRCEARCCRCCDPEIQVCCVTLCTAQCVDECASC